MNSNFIAEMPSHGENRGSSPLGSASEFGDGSRRFFPARNSGDDGMAGFGTLSGKADFVPNRGHVFARKPTAV